MTKKIKPKLIELGSTIYAVLSPGNGYLKKLYGEVHFYDALPRASGCFLSYEEADAARAKALEFSYARWQHSIEGSPWYSVRCKETYDAAAKAVVVAISVA